MYKQDRYDNDDNDMHASLLDPIYFSPFFMMTNLDYLGEKKKLPLKPIMDQSNNF